MTDFKPENSVKFWYETGLKFTQSHDYESALNAYSRALILNDNDPDIWSKKCYILIQLGNYAEAIKAGTRAVELAPDNALIKDTLREAYVRNTRSSNITEKPNANGKKFSIKNFNLKHEIVIYLFFYIFLLIIGYFITHSKSIFNNTQNFLYYVLFIVLFIGILFEGWKAVAK